MEQISAITIFTQQITAPLLLIAIILLPFLGKDGFAAGMAYAVVGLLPAGLTVYILEEKGETPAAIWLGFIWIMVVIARILEARRQNAVSAPDA